MAVPALESAAEVHALFGARRVHVYRNLNRPGRVYSVRDAATGRVIAHTAAVTVTGVMFRVQPAGRARVRAQGRKNVHAYLAGTLTGDPVEPGTAPVFYDPYTVEEFTDPTSGAAVRDAAVAWVDDTGVRYRRSR